MAQTMKMLREGDSPRQTPTKQSFFYLFLIVLSLAVILPQAAQAFHEKEGKSEKKETNPYDDVEVENFGKVTDFFYRGAQPKEEEYFQLAHLGIKTVVDLRHDPKSGAREWARRAGLRYINLPMSDKDYPSEDAATRFLALANNQENWPIFVHCAGGRHRTGVMTAVYRMTMQGWDIERAYDEMKDYDFYTRWGHKAMKQYVYDYYRQMQTGRKNQIWKVD